MLSNFREKKIILLSAGVAIAVFLGLFLATYFTFVNSFDRLDRKDIEDDAMRVSRTFKERFSVLKSKVGDWGAWDEAFRYVTQQDPTFAQANFTEIVISGLKITLIAYLAPDMKPIAVKKLVNGKLVDQDPQKYSFLKSNSPLIKDAATNISAGIVDLDGHAAIAAANVVSKGDGSGPPAGRVVFVRELDDDVLASLSEQTLLKVSLFSGVTPPPESASAIEFSDGTIQVLSSDMARAFIPLQSESTRVGTLQVEIPRDISRFGRENATRIMSVFVIFLIGLLGAAAIILKFSGAAKSLPKILDANRQLKQREAYLAALIDSVPGYVSWFDRSLRYIGVNSKLANDYKLDPADFIGKEIGFQHQQSEPDLKSELREFFESSAHSNQSTIMLGDETNRRQFLVCFEKYDSNQAAVVIGIDTTSTWLAEQQSAKDRQVALQASKMSSLGEMAGGIAHEINNPLAIIQAGCRKLAKRLTQAGQYDPHRETVEMIEATALRIGKIISGLRTFSRDGTNDAFAVASFDTILTEMLALCAARFRNSGVEIRRQESGLNIPVRCRSVQLGQVLINLLNNSFDAVVDSQGEKWVEIGAFEDGESVVISVTDSGHGISPSVAARMMDPFFTTKAVGKGTGLGLSISHGIIRDHGGELLYDQNSANTRFVIRLPKVATIKNFAA